MFRFLEAVPTSLRLAQADEETHERGWLKATTQPNNETQGKEKGNEDLAARRCDRSSRHSRHHHPGLRPHGPTASDGSATSL
jgi:hypothetical protein